MLIGLGIKIIALQVQDVLMAIRNKEHVKGVNALQQEEVVLITYAKQFDKFLESLIHTIGTLLSVKIEGFIYNTQPPEGTQTTYFKRFIWVTKEFSKLKRFLDQLSKYEEKIKKLETDFLN